MILNYSAGKILDCSQEFGKLSSETVFSTKKKKKSDFLASLKLRFWPQERFALMKPAGGPAGLSEEGREPVCFAHSSSIPVIDVSTGHVNADF